MRIASLPEQGFIYSTSKPPGVGLVGPTDSIAQPRWHISAGSFDPYYPLDPLAVSPDGRRAWLQGSDGRAARVDLEHGRVEQFAFGLRDAVYGPEGSVFAVLDAHEQPTLVEFHDDAPLDQRTITCADAPRIHWPYAAPYHYAAYSDDWRGALRLTATRWGVALAHVSGLLWVHAFEPAGRRMRAWTMPPVYQGWTCAYVHAEGVVVTCVHNGRTGDIVWLDHDGVWHDCFDSNWRSLGPCVPSSRGFVSAIDDALVRFEGTPLQICERTFIGERIEDLAVDLAGRVVSALFSDRAAQTCGAGEQVRVWFGDDIDVVQPERVTAPRDEPAWRYEAIDDPTLGRIWKPDLARARELAEQLAHAPDPRAALLAALPGAALPDDAEPLEPLELVLQRLRRWIAPSLSRAQLFRAVERLVDEPLDDYLASALQDSLPSSLRAAGRPTAPVSTWIREHLAASFDGLANVDGCGEQPVRQASLVADLHARPVWSLQVTLADGRTLHVSLDDFDMQELRAGPSELSDEVVVVSGRLHAAGTDQPVLVTLDPFPGGFAQRVTVARQRSNEPLLRCAALFEPVILDTLDHARVLAYSAPRWPVFYVGQHEGHTCASPFADDLDDARVFERPAPLPAMRALLDGLVSAQLLELVAAPDDELLWAVEIAVCGSAPDRAAQALETLLLDHDGVDELFAELEQLREHVAQVCATGC